MYLFIVSLFKVRKIFEELLLEWFVELHEGDVGEVPEEEDQGLPPIDHVVQEEDDEDDESNAVECGVPDEGPGRQLQGWASKCVTLLHNTYSNVLHVTSFHVQHWETVKKTIYEHFFISFYDI